VHLPRDHFGHPASSIEWWYFTGVVRDRAGTPYSVFFTLFSSRGTLLALAQVRDLESGVLVGRSEQLASGRVGPNGVDVRAGGSRLDYVPRSNAWSFSVSDRGLRVALRQGPEKPYVLHGGGTGVIEQGPGERSHYYSATRMAAAGMLAVRGRTVAVAGESWFDHQWGDYLGDPRAFDWDWFSCRFGDDTELMLYQFLDRRTHRPLARFDSGTFVDRIGRPVAVGSFRAQAGHRALAAAGRRWPLDWRLSVPALRITEDVRSLVRDQLVRSTFVPTFWEGAARATGTRAGTCSVEISYR
jgi:predicted secreted hydrolase